MESGNLWVVGFILSFMSKTMNATTQESAPELRSLAAEVAEVERRFEKLVGGLRKEVLTQRPDADGWSAVQCIDHLNVTLRRYLPAIEAAIRQGRLEKRVSPGPFPLSWLERWFIRQIEPPVGRRFKAPPSFQPEESPSPSQVDREFKDLRRRLREAMGEAHGLDLLKLRVSSPAFSWFRISLHAAFAVMIAHDRRHLDQAEGVVERLGR